MGVPALDGNLIGVFAWYEHGLAFTDGEYADLHAHLSNKSSKSPDEYYDGTYVYDYSYYYLQHEYITYNVRVRKDGYVLAWLDNTINAGIDFLGYANPLSQRLINNLMSAAGVNGFDYLKCYYYNLNYPDAVYVRWFGFNVNQGGPSWDYFQFTVPADLVVSCERLRYIINVGWWAMSVQIKLTINGTEIDSCTAPEALPCVIKDEIDLTPYLNPRGVENSVGVYVQRYSSRSRQLAVVYFIE